MRMGSFWLIRVAYHYCCSINFNSTVLHRNRCNMNYVCGVTLPLLLRLKKLLPSKTQSHSSLERSVLTAQCKMESGKADNRVDAVADEIFCICRIFQKIKVIRFSSWRKAKWMKILLVPPASCLHHEILCPSKQRLVCISR